MGCASSAAVPAPASTQRALSDESSVDDYGASSEEVYHFLHLSDQNGATRHQRNDEPYGREGALPQEPRDAIGQPDGVQETYPLSLHGYDDRSRHSSGTGGASVSSQSASGATPIVSFAGSTNSSVDIINPLAVPEEDSVSGEWENGSETEDDYCGTPHSSLPDTRRSNSAKGFDREERSPLWWSTLLRTARPPHRRFQDKREAVLTAHGQDPGSRLMRTNPPQQSEAQKASIAGWLQNQQYS